MKKSVKKKLETRKQITPWVPLGIGFVIVMGVGIWLGLKAEDQFGGVVQQKFFKTTSIVPKTNTIVAPTPTVTEVLPTPPSDKDAQLGEYILPFSATRIVNVEDLAGLSPWELKVARNEIYARHGRTFVHQDLSCYFAKQSWYQTDANYSDKNLSKIEVANATTILNFEKSTNSPLVAKDSGCQ
jgi:hypothetical protein